MKFLVFLLLVVALICHQVMAGTIISEIDNAADNIAEAASNEYHNIGNAADNFGQNVANAADNAANEISNLFWTACSNVFLEINKHLF